VQARDDVGPGDEASHDLDVADAQREDARLRPVAKKAAPLEVHRVARAFDHDLGEMKPDHTFARSPQKTARRRVRFAVRRVVVGNQHRNVELIEERAE
jgi:hypothetical protein